MFKTWKEMIVIVFTYSIERTNSSISKSPACMKRCSSIAEKLPNLCNSELPSHAWSSVSNRWWWRLGKCKATSRITMFNYTSCHPNQEIMPSNQNVLAKRFKNIQVASTSGITTLLIYFWNSKDFLWEKISFYNSYFLSRILGRLPSCLK